MIATALLSLVLLYWVLQALGVARLVRRLSVLEAVAVPERDAWPKLSIVIPARNEARTLEAALRSKLAEGYPNVELVVVEDRSTDATGEIADRLAASDPRIRVVHVVSLPDGWLGKLHALQRGLEASTGEWVLFSDADIHFAPGALRRAIAHCEARSLDHLGVFPQMWPSPFLIDVTLAGFTRITILMGRMWRVEDPRSRAAGGVGAFNLVRRAMLDRTPGLEWLKMEVGDDVALGQMLKRCGARSAIVNGRGQVSLRLYDSWKELLRSVEKGSAVFGFRIAPPIIMGVVLGSLELGAFAGLFAGGAARWLAVASVALGTLVSLGVCRFFAQRALPALFGLFGGAILVGIIAVQGVRVALQRGLYWRGTFYPAKQLLAGRRMEFL